MNSRPKPAKAAYLEQSGLRPDNKDLITWTKSVISPPVAEDRDVRRRSVDRYRRILLSSGSSAVARVISMVFGLVTVRLTLDHLGVERYGLWMTIISVNSFLTFADLGLGNGLLTALSHAHGKGDRELARRLVTTTFFCLSGLAAICAALLLLLYPAVSWQRAFNVHSAQAVQEAGPATLAFLLLSLANMPLSVVARVQLAYQEGFYSGLWQIIGSVLGLAGILAAVSGTNNVLWLIVALSGTQFLVALANNVQQFVFARPWLAPRLRDFSWPVAKSLSSTGAQFLFLQVVGLVGFSLDAIILAQRAGPESVAQYAIIQKLFGIPLALQQLYAGPLWPAYGEAFARKDFGWIRSAVNKSMIAGAVIALVFCTPLVLFGRTLIWYWVQNPIAIPLSALLASGLWALLSGWGNATASFLNALNEMRVQMLSGAVFAVLSVVVKISVAHDYGVSGVIWATVLTYSLAVVVPVWRGARRVLTSLPLGNA